MVDVNICPEIKIRRGGGEKFADPSPLIFLNGIALTHLIYITWLSDTFFSLMELGQECLAVPCVPCCILQLTENK